MGAAVSVWARRSARRAGKEGEDGGEQRDLGGAAVGLPDGGGAAEPARDGRGHHHRALGRRRPPRRHGRRRRHRRPDGGPGLRRRRRRVAGAGVAERAVLLRQTCTARGASGIQRTTIQSSGMDGWMGMFVPS